MLIFGQKAYFLGHTIFKVPQPNWYYCEYTLVILDLQLDFLHFFRFFESPVNFIPPGLSVCSLVGRNFDHMRAVFQWQ